MNPTYTSASPVVVRTLRTLSLLFAGWLALTLQIRGADGATGSLTGRVFNEAIGSYVNNARVVIESLKLETFTDENGLYSFPRVPAGEVVVRVIYTGFPVETQTVGVASGQRAERDFSLR